MSYEQTNDQARYRNETARRSGTGPWHKMTAIGSVLSPIVLIVCAALAWRVHEADLLRSQSDASALQNAVAGVASAVQATTAVKWVRSRDTANNCYATNQRFECTVTNAREEAIEACFVGILSQKKGGGSMRSFPLCTGRIAPRETREVSVPWERGSASDICNKLTYGDTRVLDWDSCDFTSEGVDPGGSGWAPAKTP
jgi:hypothetical protein